jgi:hypothetical protein
MIFLRRAIGVFLFFILFFQINLSAEEIDAEELAELQVEQPAELQAFQSQLDIEELRRRIYGEDPEEFMSLSLMDSEVSLFLTGSWKGSLQANFGFANTPIGASFASPETPLLFTQEADLTMSLWINDRWFVGASFLDDNAQNTYRAGYQGLSGEFLEYAGIGNTGLDFPSFPYLDLGGDSPSSFGFYSRMSTGSLDIHTLFRYDAASREERVFTGSRERTFSYVQPQDFIRGVSFVLPDVNIDSEITVYIEDDKGSLRDLSGRRWRLALSSEYAAGRTQGLLELSIRPAGMVAVSYSKNGARPWNFSMGYYDSPGTFLYNVQQHFDSISLENYPQCGGSRILRRPGEVNIGGNYALVIREPGTFSPFERHNRYDAPSSASEEAALVRLSSGAQIGGFELAAQETSFASADIPMFTAAASRRNIYELLPAMRNISQRDPETRWPLAKEYPEIYLPGSGIFTGDIALRFTNFSGTSGYFIGTDVVPGSIQVWRSGIQDTNFSYNFSVGEVILHGAAGQNELIRITYLKQSEETRLGSIAAGLGAIYRSGASPFSAQAALGIRWNLTEDSAFTEEGHSSMGTVGLSAKTAWDYDFFNAQITAGLAVEQPDTTGLYRVAGMEGSETIIALPPERSFLSHPPASDYADGLLTGNRADLIYRNYYNNNILGSTLMPIGWGGSLIVANIDRPYPVKDPLLGDSQTLTAEFVLNSAEKWTGFQVPLMFNSENISRASEIEIPYRLFGFSGDIANFKLIVQIGSLSGRDFAILENPELIWEKELVPAVNPFDSNPHIARFSINEADRLELNDARYLRIIAVYEGSQEISGRVIIAPPIVRGASFRPVTFDGDTVRGMHDFSPFNQVTAIETIEMGLNTLETVYSDIIRRLHPVEGTQRVLKIQWENMQNGISAGVDGRVGELPLSDYRQLSFFVKGPESIINGGSLSFIVAPGEDMISQPELEAHIPLGAFRAGQWSKVTIRYQGGNTGVTVDGIEVQGASFRYNPMRASLNNSRGRSSYIAVFINPENTFTFLPDSSIYIDEIILEDSSLVYRMNAGAAFEYTRPGTLLSFDTIPVLSDFFITSAVESEFRADGNQESFASGSMFNRTGAGVSIFGTDVQGNIFSTVAQDTFLWSADHSISRIIGPFSFKESFFASPLENNVQHNINLTFLSDFYSRFNADALYDFSGLRQRWNLDTGFRPQNVYIPAIAVNTEAMWSRSDQTLESENYGELWLQTWSPLIPDAGNDANSRRTLSQIVLTQRTRPVGAIISVQGLTSFTGVNSITRSESQAFLDIPVEINRTNINFRFGRGYKRHLNFFGNDFFDDSGKFFESINDSLPFFGVIPIYSLFTPQLNEVMNTTHENSPSEDIAFYTAFNDHFGTSINFPPVFNLAAFIIPSRAALRLERTLEKKMDTDTDILNLGAGIGFSAINMFGRMGYYPLFNFYQTDEFNHAVEGAVIFSGDDISWRIQSVAGAGFRGFTGGVLSFVNTLTVRSGGYWLESFAASWTTPTKKSLISVLYDWIPKSNRIQHSMPGLASLLNSDYDQFRRETLELTFDKTGEYLRWSVAAGHEEIIRVTGRLEFTIFMKLRCSEDLYNEIFVFDTLIGTTLRISF